MKTKICISKGAKISFSVFIVLLMIIVVLSLIYGSQNLLSPNHGFEYPAMLFSMALVFSFCSMLYCIIDIHNTTISNKIIHQKIQQFKAANMPCEIQCSPSDKFNIMALNNKTKDWYVFKHKGEMYLLNNYGVFFGGDYNDGQFLYGCAETLVMDDYYNRLIDKAIQNGSILPWNYNVSSMNTGFVNPCNYNVNAIKLFRDNLFLIFLEISNIEPMLNLEYKEKRWFIGNTKILLPIESHIAQDILDEKLNLKTTFEQELQRRFGNI